MTPIPVPLDWLQRAAKLLEDVRESADVPLSMNCRARVLGSELVKIVADAPKEKP